MPAFALTGRPRSHLFWAAGLFALGTWAGLSVRWIADDAYISFRYARHLVEGFGLVYNAGEYVEGYTNLLWTLWMAVGLSLGLPIEGFAQWSGALCFGALAAGLAWARLSDRLADGVRGGIPLAALLLIMAPDAREFATAGLEGALFSLLSWAGLRAIARPLPRPLWAGIWLGLACLTRPDGVVLVAAALAGGCLSPRLSARGFVALLSPIAVLVGGQLAFRLAYYGDVLPNTYYAKSAWLPYWSQGLAYARFFFQHNWVLLLAVPAWLWLVVRDLRRGRGVDRELVWLLAASAYTFYVVRVGGDFMYARLLVPTIALWACALESAFDRAQGALGGRPLAWGLARALVVAAIFVAPPPDQAAMWARGIALERGFPDPDRAVPHRAEILAGFLARLDVGVAFVGGDARLMYRARVPVAVECETGLTDRRIARQPLGERGRVGHEKPAPVAYILDERSLDLTFRKRALSRLGLMEAIPLVPIEFGPVRGYLLRWRPDLIETLRARGAIVMDFPRQLDRLIASLPHRSDAEVAALHAKLRRFYFAHARDPKRERPFLARLH